ncbi:DUF995 domain-containing protein [Pseudooceanicola aestuarii]|uniref:DUF995 domain-containing protein n=1 Tax=Pseudooceanicola aestuarii TaxID=2697319 RepID=UPI0013D10C2F|nr:DUF995 domain-containing protein [Pseudooceanicola aestuarii]
MTRLIFAVTAALGLAPPAMAQDWNSFVTASGRGAVTCPADPAERTDYFCFALACRSADAPLQWVISLPGEDAPDRLTLRIEMRQEIVGQMLMTRLNTPAGLSYAADVLEAHAPMVEDLAAGLNARLHLGEYGSMVTVDIRLGGSRDAITALDDLCPAPGLHPVPDFRLRPVDPDAAATYGLTDIHTPAPPPDPAPDTGAAAPRPETRITAPLPGEKPETAGPYTLSSAEVMAQIIDRPLIWHNRGGTSYSLFQPDGRMIGRVESRGKVTPHVGEWSLQPDGQLCWTAQSRGCFIFRQLPDGVHAFRAGAGDGLDLGVVRFPEK